MKFEGIPVMNITDLEIIKYLTFIWLHASYSLAIEYHLNEAIARKELVEFLLLFPPASSLIEGETQLTDL